MSTTSRFRIAADLPKDVQTLLLRRFPPAFSNVHCKTLTKAYMVDADYQYQEFASDVSVYGYHRGATHEAVLVRINGRTRGNDQPGDSGTLYFICLSVADGEKPFAASQIDELQIEYLEFEIPLESLCFNRFPVWNNPGAKKAA